MVESRMNKKRPMTKNQRRLRRVGEGVLYYVLSHMPSRVFRFIFWGEIGVVRRMNGTGG